MKRFLVFSVITLVFWTCGCMLRGDRHETLNGSLKGHGVSAPVSIVYDAHGVPHISAVADSDLYYALGYIMAQDRFFQMDIFRKAGRGELCKLLGRPPHSGNYDLLTFDRLIRPFGFPARADKGVKELDPRSKVLLNMFAAGVNRYLEDAGRDLPEYRALGVAPEPWAATDSLVCMDIFGLSMTLYSFFYEYYATRLVNEIGMDKARLFIPEYPPDAPYINRDSLPVAANESAFDEIMGAIGKLMPAISTLGSNNWVVDGTMSASGKPILCNDPHVPTLLTPTYWYHAHLKSLSHEEAGLIFPGAPLMGAGTNGRLAWGITNARCDYIDIFRMKVDPQNPKRYSYKGKWREFSTVNETIPVKRGRDFKYGYRVGVHGPVIEEALTGYEVYNPEGEVFALKLIDVNWGRFIGGYMEVPRSGSPGYLKETIRHMSMGPVAWNTVYATTNGDIGYLYSGHAPVRPDNQGVIARRGTGEDDWGGWIPFNELPHTANPSKHFIVTANNKVEGPDYPHYLSSGYAKESRAARISEMLAGRTGLTVADMETMHMDVKVKSAEKVVPILIEDLAGQTDGNEADCAEALDEWKRGDYFATLDSRGTGVYKLILSNMVKATFNDDLGEKLVSNMSQAEMTVPALMKIIDEPDSKWYDDSTTPAIETRRDIVRASAVAAAKYLRKRLGKDPSTWRWGKMQTLMLRHPLGFLPWNKKARIAKLQLPGTGETVNNAGGIFIGRLGYINIAGPSSRITVDMSRPREINFMATTSNTENYKSSLYGLTTQDWYEGRYRTLNMDEELYRKGALAELSIEP